MESKKLPACERCRTKKIRCDSNIPSCSTCTKLGITCLNKDKVLGTVVDRKHLLSLNERLQNYDGNKRQRISGNSGPHGENVFHRMSGTEANPELNPGSIAFLTSESHTLDSDSNSDNDEQPMEHENHVRNTMESLLSAAFSGNVNNVNGDLSQMSSYGSSEGKTARQVFIDNENLAIGKLGRDFLKQARRNQVKNRITDLTAYDIGILTRLSKRYTNWINSAYPVLHECMLHLQVVKCKNKPSEADPDDLFQVKMVMAISLASISRPHGSTSEIGRMAHLFWKSATRPNRKHLFGQGLIKLQNILLLLQYTLLVPNSGNLWHLSGTAMRYATEMGLYSEQLPSQKFDTLTSDLRKRLFWTCYCIDRILCTVMGRPSSIPDSWITVKWPALVEDKLITVNGIESGPICHLKLAQIQQIRICRLQSEIHKKLYAISPEATWSEEDLATWSWQMYDQLRLWRNAFVYPTPFITKEWTELQFHIAVVLLFRPSPNRTNLSPETLHVAFHSAGEVMKLVKIMHRDCSAVFSWLTVQNLFMCGLTFINSLKELADENSTNMLCIPFFEIFLQIQSCSTMLETLSTLETGASEKIRNAFETISSGILQNITNSAMSLPQINNYKGCIWAHIAKDEKLSLERPINIDGVSISVKNESYVLYQTNVTSPESFIGNDDDQHFLLHDTDASATNLQLSESTNDYSIKVRVSANKDTNNNSNQQHIVQRIQNKSTYGIFQNQSPSANESIPEGIGIPNQSSTGSETDIPAWSNTNLSAELEKWFLHPLPDSNDNFSI